MKKKYYQETKNKQFFTKKKKASIHAIVFTCMIPLLCHFTILGQKNAHNEPLFTLQSHILFLSFTCFLCKWYDIQKMQDICQNLEAKLPENDNRGIINPIFWWLNLIIYYMNVYLHVHVHGIMNFDIFTCIFNIYGYNYYKLTA